MNTGLTTVFFWDCDCYVNYIHPKTQTHCNKCGAYADDSPDSRIEEVIEFIKQKAESDSLN